MSFRPVGIPHSCKRATGVYLGLLQEVTEIRHFGLRYVGLSICRKTTCLGSSSRPKGFIFILVEDCSNLERHFYFCWPVWTVKMCGRQAF